MENRELIPGADEYPDSPSEDEDNGKEEKEKETLNPGTDKEHPIGHTEEPQGAAKHSDSSPEGEHTDNKEEETTIQGANKELTAENNRCRVAA